MEKLGLVAGAGPLPVAVARECRAAGRPLYIVRLKSLAEASLAEYPSGEAGLTEFGRIFRLLKDAGCHTVCMAGIVNRPDFRTLVPDLKGLSLLPSLLTAARKGFEAGRRDHTGRFWRMTNELPFVAAIIMVIAVTTEFGNH